MSRTTQRLFRCCTFKYILSFTEQYLRAAVRGWPSPCGREIRDGADGDRTEKVAAAPCAQNLPQCGNHGHTERSTAPPRPTCPLLPRGARKGITTAAPRGRHRRACDRRHRRVSRSVRAQRCGIFVGHASVLLASFLLNIDPSFHNITDFAPCCWKQVRRSVCVVFRSSCVLT